MGLYNLLSDVWFLVDRTKHRNFLQTEWKVVEKVTLGNYQDVYMKKGQIGFETNHHHHHHHYGKI